MSTPNEDLAQLRTRLESWAARIPSQARVFHERRNDLVKRIRAISGSFARRDPAETAAIVRQFLNLEGDLPFLEELAAAVEAARVQITELSAASIPASVPADAPQIGPLVQEWCGGWQFLLDVILRDMADRKNSAPFLSQVKQIQTWSKDRKRALAILVEAAGLRDSEKDHDLLPEIDAAIQKWQVDFCKERVNAAWLADVETSLNHLRESSHASQTAPEASSQPSTKTPLGAPPQLSQKAPSEASLQPPKKVLPELSSQPPKPSAKAPPEASSQLSQKAPSPQTEVQDSPESTQFHFYNIDQLLLNCRDLTEALVFKGSEIADFRSRQWQLRNRADAGAGDVRKLEAEIAAFQQTLLEHAAQECDRRLQQLQIRWQWFKAVYEARPEIAELVARAEETKAEAANRLTEFFEIMDRAEQLIYAIVDSNRPKLAAHVRNSAEACRAQVKALRGQARLIAVDAELASIERRIPEDPGTQVNAVESFERLEKCHSLQRALENLRSENSRQQEDAIAKTAQLRKLASDLAAVSDAKEISGIASQIPRELSPDRPLEEALADLNRIGQLLQTELVRVREQKKAELLRLRKENAAWIRQLAEFAPEAEAFVTSGPPPEDLEPLATALDIELRYQQRIVEMVGRAACQLTLRRDAAGTRLREHLDTPAFETHPERETAEDLLSELDSLPPLPEPPKRSEFTTAYDAVLEAEAFIDRIESARRVIPERIKTLEDRFGVLREWNAIEYRPDLARRANTLLLGMQQAMDRQQWEPLAYQLNETDILLTALHGDAIARISAEMEDLVAKLENARKTFKEDKPYVHQIESALKQLDDEGQLEPPSYATRQRLKRLLGRKTVAREARTT